MHVAHERDCSKACLVGATAGTGGARQRFVRFRGPAFDLGMRNIPVCVCVVCVRVRVFARGYGQQPKG